MAVIDILMLTNAIYPDKTGGLERHVRDLSGALVRRGYAVAIVARAESPDLPPVEAGADGVLLLRHGVPRKSNALFAAQYPAAVVRGVRDVLKKNPGAFVHGHYAFTTFPASIGSRRYVYTFHAPVHKEVLSERQDSYRLAGGLQNGAVAGVRRLEARVVSKAESIFVHTDFMRRQAEELCPVGLKVRTVPGGFDETLFVKKQSPPKAPHDETCPKIFTARRLTPRTGVLELIQAWPNVLNRYPGATLRVAGTGTQKNVIEQLIMSQGLGTSVELLGRVSDAALVAEYQAADLTVMPTQELEGFGLSTAESLACGTPVVVTPVGANPELVSDLDGPWLAASASSVDIGAAIVTAVRHLADSPDLSQHLRDYALQRWSWSVLSDQFLAGYRAAGFDR